MEICGPVTAVAYGVFSAEDVTRGKPAPDLFLQAAAGLIAPPQRCVVVEDSPAGVEAAKDYRAGIGVGAD